MSKILEIPDELFLYLIFKYVDNNTLFHTLPFVCKHFKILFETYLIKNEFIVIKSLDFGIHEKKTDDFINLDINLIPMYSMKMTNEYIIKYFLL